MVLPIHLEPAVYHVLRDVAVRSETAEPGVARLDRRRAPELAQQTLIADERTQHVEREPDLEVVAQAGSLTEARAEVSDKAQRIDLALVDLLLPDGIGTDVIRDLRATRPDVPVLVLTVARGPNLHGWVRAMGADEVISKDASTQEILAAIRILLRV